MQADRGVRLEQAMSLAGVDALLLLGNSNVSYVTGASWPLGDSGRALLERPVAVLAGGDSQPHLFTPFRDSRLELSIPEDHLHGPVYLDFDEGARSFGRMLSELAPRTSRWAVDEFPGSLQRNADLLFPNGPPTSADDVVGAAKLIKTSDELGFMRLGLEITEQAIAPVQALLEPGVRQTDLTAEFFRAAFDLGAEGNILDPIWQVMPPRVADGPWTTHGDIACPLVSTERELVAGDVLWVDTGISYAGFASDFGRTWVVGQEPSKRQHAQFRAWKEIIGEVLSEARAGATGADLTRAAMRACAGRKPWMHHFYLAHGLGIESAEPPFIGTDLGEAYDERQVLAPGMVVVFEPLVWDEGASGYRSEEVVVITDDGWLPLTDYPYDPYVD
jgi:Xaa-Pro dipeptidase